MMELGATPHPDARLHSLLRREVSRPAEVAALLFEVHAVAERLAQLGQAGAKRPEVAAFAQESLGTLRTLHAGLLRNCTSLRSESTYRELVALRGQDMLFDLHEAEPHDETQFERRYLFHVAASSAEFVRILDTWVSPRTAIGEAQELRNLRSVLIQQANRAEELLESEEAPALFEVESQDA